MIQIYSPANTNYDVNGDAVLLPTVCEIDTDTWQLTIEHPRDSEGRWKLIEDGAVLKVPSFLEDDQLFRIFNTDKDESGVSATAQPIFFDSKNDCMLLDVRPTDKNGQQALDIMTQGTKYSGSSDITSVSTAYYVMKNLMEALTSDDENSFINRWGGEVLYNNYEVIINEKIGSDHGVQLLYGKNIPENGMSVEVDSSEVVTRIYPKAYNGRMMSNNGYVDSDNIDNYPTVKQAVMEFSDVRLAEDVQAGEDTEGMIICNTQTELDSALQTKCEEQYEAGIDTPNVTIKCDMLLLANTVNYADIKELETVSQGDTVYCKNQLLGVTTTARVQSLVYDCILDCVKSVVIGSKPYNYIDNTSSTISAADKVIDKGNNTLMADRIAGIINLMNTSLRAQKNIAQKQDVRAILFEDLDPSSSTFGALCIGTQGIQISKERNESNTDWVWGTAINFESIIADYIITGILSDRLGKNSWNLDTGVLTTKDIVVEDGTFSGTIFGSTIDGGTINGTIVNSEEGNIAGFEITDEGFKKTSVIQLQKVYTESDVERAIGIVTGSITPTDQDYQLYDITGDGVISSQDVIRIEQFYVPIHSDQLITEITINCDPYNNQDVNAPALLVVIKGATGDVAFEANLSARLLSIDYISSIYATFQSIETDFITALQRATFVCENEPTMGAGNIRAGYYNGSPNIYIDALAGYVALYSAENPIYYNGNYIDANWSEGAFYPSGTGHVALGKSDTSNRWYRLYANNASSESSDERLKDNMVSFDERFIKFYEMIEPIIYNWKDDKNLTKEAGYSAQKVIDAMKECGISKEEFCCYEQDEKGYYSLIYRHFQILSHYYILEKEKQHKQEIESLERRISILEEAMNK